MKSLISFLLFLLFALLGMWWYYSCDWCLGDRDNNSSIEEKIDPEAEAIARKAYEDSLALAHGLFAKNELNNDVFRYADNLRINNTNGDVHVPEPLNDFANKIANYLGNNQNQEVTIYGYETNIEKGATINFGISRANYIRELLINSGVNGDRIVTGFKTVDYTYDPDGNYHGGILVNFNSISEDRLAEIEKGVANRTLYSNFGETEFKPDATLSNYTLELKSYLAKYQNKKVIVTGHTDDVGSEIGNQNFGLSRSNNVRNYFISQGIASDKVTSDSKGESAPVAPNDTEENRAKNRRIEIIVN